MADKKIKVSVDVDSNLEPTIANLKELKKQLKQTAAGSDEFKKIFNQIDDLEDKIKSAKGASSDWIDTLESAGGPIGALGGALNKAKVATVSFGSALKAAGIGLIVSAVAGLVAAFTQVEGAGKKLEPLLIGFEKILGGIFEALTPLIDSFVELATQALPYITTSIKVFYSSLVSLFTLVKEGGAGIGKILKGIFTLDTKSIEEGFDQLKGSWSKTVDSYNATSERFEAGTKKLTKTEKENQKERNDNAQKALDEKIKRLEAEDKLDEARLEKLKQEALKVAETEQQKLDVETAFAQKLYDLRLKDLNDKQALYKKDSIEFKNLEAEKIKVQADFISQTIAFGETQKQITEKNSKDLLDSETNALQLRKAKGEVNEDEYQQLIFEIKKKYAKDNKELVDAEIALETYKTEQKKKLADLEKGDNDSRYARLAAGAQFDLELQRSLLEQKKLNDEAYYATQLANENLTAEQIRELNDRKLSDQIFYTEKSNQIERDRIAVKQQALDDIISIAGAETDIGKAALIAKQVLAAKELILEVTRTITFSAQAAARSTVAVAEGTAQTAKVGFPQNIPLLIGYAAQAFGIISAIKSAVSSAKASATGNGSSIPSISAPPAPSYGGTPTMTTPQIQTGVGQNPNTQLAQTLSNSQRPIRAYVVSQDISSQQALDRRTSVAATFSAG